MNRLIGFFILVFLITTFAHGQVEIINFDRETQLSQEQPVKKADTTNNWFSGEFLFLFGVGARYERMLSPMFSLGANFSYHWFLFMSEIGIRAFFRYYPWRKAFFLGAASGFSSWSTSLGPGTSGYGLGMEVTPEIGWKIDVGKAGGFFISPGIKWPLFFGYRIDVGFKKTTFRLLKARLPLLIFGLGYAF